MVLVLISECSLEYRTFEKTTVFKDAKRRPQHTNAIWPHNMFHNMFWFLTQQFVIINISMNYLVYVIWMWIDWYRKYQPAEPEYEVCWRVSEANESQSSYSVEQADIFQYQSYSHSDDMFIILKSNKTRIHLYLYFRGKNYMIQNIQKTIPQNRSS